MGGKLGINKAKAFPAIWRDKSGTILELSVTDATLSQIYMQCQWKRFITLA